MTISGWDHHCNLKESLGKRGTAIYKPIAGLLSPPAVHRRVGTTGEGKLFTMLAGKRQDRGKEAVEKGVPALEALCGSLTKGDVEAVNGLAFLVKPKE